MVTLVNDIGIDLQPAKSPAVVQVEERRPLVQCGALDGFSACGRQLVMQVTNQIASFRNITVHVRHRGESIFELALFGHEVSTFIRRLATDFGLLVENFVSKNTSGWSLHILDTKW